MPDIMITPFRCVVLMISLFLFSVGFDHLDSASAQSVTLEISPDSDVDTDFDFALLVCAPCPPCVQKPNPAVRPISSTEEVQEKAKMALDKIKAYEDKTFGQQPQTQGGQGQGQQQQQQKRN